MNAKDILDIVGKCDCGDDCHHSTQLTKIAFEIAAKQKEFDAKLAAEMGSLEIAEAIMTTE